MRKRRKNEVGQPDEAIAYRAARMAIDRYCLTDPQLARMGAYIYAAATGHMRSARQRYHAEQFLLSVLESSEAVREQRGR